MILHREKPENPLYTREQLSQFLKNKRNILRTKQDRDFLDFVRNLKKIDDIVIYYQTSDYYIYLYNPSNGRLSQITYQSNYDYDTGEYRKGPKRCTIEIGNNYAHSTILKKRNLFIGQDFTKNQALEIAKNWVLYDKIPDFVRKKYTSVFQSKK